ncbi:MAG: family 1 glycosylhydrolase [Promicromonosporaceae bacterium]|nr:family 1 glycosylhydrolase [Promicromonosporaceae bacterium]
MTAFPNGFLWGAATAAHQIEGNNTNSDFWANEGRMPGMERSGDACDSYHRYREDMQLMVDAGLNSYRFSLEWARIEPVRGLFSNAELAHYRRMIDTALELGLTPVVTLHHFTNPRWFAEAGGWLADDAVVTFCKYVEKVCTILDGVEWVVTMNEPNMLAVMTGMQKAMAAQMQAAVQGGDKPEGWQSPTIDEERKKFRMPTPEVEIGKVFVEVHQAAREVVRAKTNAKVGWSVANRAFEVLPGGEEKFSELSYVWEDLYLEPSREDDFVGVQCYTVQQVDADGLVPHPEHPDNTLVGTAFRPDAVGVAVRHTAKIVGDVPIMVTENGIAIDKDERRIKYTSEALGHLAAAMADGIDVRGYLHWSLLDNYEWGHWKPTFGLIAVDRETFVRTPKPSLAWLGGVAQAGALPA